MGARRLAAGTLQGFLKDNESKFSSFFHPNDWKRVIARRPKNLDRKDKNGGGFIPDANNGFPLNEERLRISFLNLANSEICHYAQIVEFLTFVKEMRDEYPTFKYGRTIALLCRAANSAKYGYTPGLPSDEKKAYSTLKKRYSDTKTHSRRIKEIEEEIGKEQIWNIR